MKQIKKEFRFFTIAQWEQEQDYLRQRHKQGWAFQQVSFPGIYTFCRCTPEDVVYQLDYHPSKGAERDDYLQLFSDCGWEYLQDFVGYSYFRKPVSQMQGEQEEAIFCDDESRYEMLKRVFQGRMLPLIPMLLCVILPQMLTQWSSDFSGRYIVLVFFSALFVTYALLLGWFGYQFYKASNTLRHK